MELDNEDNLPDRIRAVNQDNIKPINLQKIWKEMIAMPLTDGPVYGFNKHGLNCGVMKDGIIYPGKEVYARNNG